MKREELIHAGTSPSRASHRPARGRHRPPLPPSGPPPRGAGVRRVLGIPENWRRGALRPPADAPPAGESFSEVLRRSNVVVEHILSGPIGAPKLYAQDQDEWVLVLAGRAALAVAGEQVDMGAGEWLFLPGGTPHTVLHTEPGTSWLAVHVYPA